MSEHNLLYYPYASFKDARLPLLRVAARYFNKLALLDQVAANWNIVGVDHVTSDAVRQVKDSGISDILSRPRCRRNTEPRSPWLSAEICMISG